jgi:hypothetical protein
LILDDTVVERPQPARIPDSEPISNILVVDELMTSELPKKTSIETTLPEIRSLPVVQNFP